jgi:hypothetical protein
MRTEICEVLDAIIETSEKHPSILKALSYKVSKSISRASIVLQELQSGSKKKKKKKDNEDKEIIALLDGVNKGSIEFWNPNTPLRYNEKQLKFLNTQGYYCIALSFILKDAGIHHRILRRFTYRVVHELTLSGGRNAQSISNDLEDAGITPEKSYEELLKEVTSIVNAGRRYYDLAKELGDGVLFFLPDYQSL